MYSNQLSKVVENLPLDSFRSQNTDTVIELDKMVEAPDFTSSNLDTNRTGETMNGLGMDKEDLELLGFMVVAEEEEVKQRESRIEVSYVLHQGKMKRNVQLSPDQEVTGSEKNSQKSKAPVKKGVSIVYNEDKSIEQTLHSMDKSYQKHWENKVRSVQVKMTPEQISQIQLNKMYEVAEIIQQQRVKQVMVRMMSMATNSEQRSLSKRLLKGKIKENEEHDDLNLTKKQIEMCFNHWGDSFQELPQSLREDIIKLSRPKTFKLHSTPIKLEQKEQNMYLIVEGSALLFQNEYLFKKFNKQITQIDAQKKEKYKLVKKPNFSNLVHVGTIILKYVQKNEIIRHILARGKRRLQARRAEEKIYEAGSDLIKLGPGSTFGDFQEADGKLYKPQQVVSMSEPLKCISISKRDLQSLFKRILTAENNALIRGRIDSQQMSQNIVKKILRCFNEKVYPPGKILLEEGQPLTSIYIIKTGACEMYSKENPLQTWNKSLKDKVFFPLPDFKEEMSLGLNQGSMSKVFNYYPIGEIGSGHWVGEEAFYSKVGQLSYSVRCKSITRVLEIGLQDFEDKMPKELTQELQSIAIRKQFLKHVRMQEIVTCASDLKQAEKFHKFHAESLQSIIRMHPHASKRIITQMGNQFQLEGYLRTARQRDAVNVGQIKMKEKPVADSKLSGLVTESSQSPLRQQESNLSQKKHSTYELEKQVSVQALSPGGKGIPREMEYKQKMIDQKLKAFEQSKLQRFPSTYSSSIVRQTSTEKLSPRNNDEEKEKLKLSQQNQDRLLSFGVDQNNPKMLSLQSVNQISIANSTPRSPLAKYATETPQLNYDPTRAQLHEMNKMLNVKSRHPILEMRLQTAIKERLANKSNIVRSVPPQVFRSITFFNREQAELERAKQVAEKHQIFKLSKSVERLVTLQPVPEDPNQQITSMIHTQSSSQLIDAGYIPDSSQRLPLRANNPFAQSAKIGSANSLSPLRETRNTRNFVNANTSMQSRISQNSPIKERPRQKQSCLYHAQKVSAQEIHDLQQIKHTMNLHRSLQFKSGVHSLVKLQSGATSPQQETNDVTARQYGMINQHSSIVDIGANMFDETAEHKFQSQPRQQEMNVSEPDYEGSGAKGKRDSPSQDSSPVFRLDFSRLSINHHKRKHSDNSSIKFAKQALQAADQKVRFELDAKQERGMSRLEGEMLKDLKAMDPDFEDDRLPLLPLSPKVPAVNKSTSMINVVRSRTEDIDGDMRYLEPQKAPTRDDSVSSQASEEQKLSQKAAIEQNQSDHEKAFQEYLMVSRMNMEEELQKDKGDQLDKSEDYVQQASEQQIDERRDSSNNSHASVLEAIALTTSLYSDEKFQMRDSSKDSLKQGKSDAAILNEMLSTRQKQLLNKDDKSPFIKSKNGTFKVKNLTTLEYVPQTTSSIKQVLSPQSLAPLRASMVRSKSPRGALKTTSFNANKNALKKAKDRYATIDKEEREASAEARMNQTSQENTTGLQISQISLHVDKATARKKKLAENPPSKISNYSTSPRAIFKDKDIKKDVFKNSGQKLLMKINDSSPRRNKLRMSTSLSPTSNKKPRKTSPDLVMVMDATENINFTGKKASPKHDTSASPPNKVKIDVSYNRMRNTIQPEAAENAALFPNIGKKGTTAHYESYPAERNSRDVMNSTGTKYYVSNNQVPATGQADSVEGNSPTNLKMNHTYHGDESPKATNDYDASLLPSIKATRDLTTHAGKPSSGSPLVKKGQYMTFQEGSQETSRGDQEGADNTASKMAELTKIKVAIERSPSGHRKQTDYVKQEKQQTSQNFASRGKHINMKVKRLRKDIFTKNAEERNRQSPRHADHSPKQQSSRRGGVRKRNDDLKYASVRGALAPSEIQQQEEMLRRSELSSINKHNDPNKSLLSDIARQHYDYFNSQMAEHMQKQMLSQPIEPPSLPPQSVQDVYSPKYKHMPVTRFKNIKHNTAAMLTLQRNRHQTELPQLIQSMSPKSNSLRMKEGLSSGKGQQMAGRESNYIKNQKWRSIESKKLLDQSNQSRKRLRIEEMDIDILPSNGAKNLNRGSTVRRSQIIDKQSNAMSLLQNAAADGSDRKMARNDSLMLPQSYSRVLYRSSQGVIERQSMASLNSTSVKMGEANYSVLKVLENDNQQGERSLTNLSAAEQTKLKFQQIKEEKRRMQNFN